MKTYSNLAFIILFLTLITLEIFASFLSYENYGWGMPALLDLLIILNVIPIFLYFKKKRFIALAISVILALLIIPNQLYQILKYISLKEEAANITSFVYLSKLKTGHYPDNIHDYKFTFPQLKDHISYQKFDDLDFGVYFWIGDPNTTHYYLNSYKRWYYYDD